MKFHLVTLFPDLFESFLKTGLLGKAVTAGRIAIAFQNPRDFTEDRHRSVDDTPYGGGSGMVLSPGPMVAALEALDTSEGAPVHRVLLTPQGRPFRQRDAVRFASYPHLALVCGRYEGVDERVRSFVHDEVSLGDFVILGGEVAAMAVVEATSRLVPGVLGNADSAVDESHSQGLLEYPQYTRPPEFRGMTVPDILLSGNHGEIARWRRSQALLRTFERRPDLLSELALDEGDLALLARARSEGGR
jgi:tRNA (guanine37-N1)-methyltransferase